MADAAACATSWPRVGPRGARHRGRRHRRPCATRERDRRRCRRGAPGRCRPAAPTPRDPAAPASVADRAPQRCSAVAAVVAAYVWPVAARRRRCPTTRRGPRSRPDAETHDRQHQSEPVSAADTARADGRVHHAPTSPPSPSDPEAAFEQLTPGVPGGQRRLRGLPRLVEHGAARPSRRVVDVQSNPGAWTRRRSPTR